MIGVTLRAETIDRVLAVVAEQVITLSDVTAAISAEAANRQRMGSQPRE